MPRYNMRTLRGERVIKKKEGVRIKRWETNYERILNDTKNVLTVQKVMEEIERTFENNAIEQEKVSLICPLTKERIVVPVRYRTCHHFQCFDLKGFLAMKSKRNYLNCPYCNNIVDSELKGLCIDKYFQNILSDANGGSEIGIFGDGTFRVAPSYSSPIIPKVIDDEAPYAPEYSTTLTCKVKSESGSDDDDIEALDSVSVFANDNEINENDDETQNLHFSDNAMVGATSQAVHHSTKINGTKLKTSNDVDDIGELGPVSSFYIDAEINESYAETQNLLLPNIFIAGDINQAAHSSNAKASSKTQEKKLKCDICSYSTKYSHNLLTHRRIHSSEKPFKCTKCSYESARADILKRHMLTHTGEKPYKCCQCSYACAQSSTLKTHMRTHTGVKPFKCTQCSHACAQLCNLKTHMLTHASEKPYTSSQYSYACFQQNQLNQHMHTHTGEKPHKCNQCSFASAHLGNLKTHMLTHTGEKPHKCSQCAYTCAQAVQLVIHGSTHTGEKPYTCNHCSYTSAVSSNLQVHMRTHTGEKPYKCTECTFASAAAGHLKIHIRTHTGEKPYKCSQCSFASARQDDLKKHIRIHTGEKPYKCTKCSYASAAANSLRKHMRTHTGEKPYKCDRCSYACAVSSALKSHMRTHI